MKLLFDPNLSHKLVGRLADVFPGPEHVRNLDLHRADDAEVWEYARINALAIVSKDEDFHQLSFLHGPPPKVVWVRLVLFGSEKRSWRLPLLAKPRGWESASASRIVAA